MRPQPEHTTWWWWFGLARDVGVLAAGQVDPLDGAQLDQQVEGPEDRGAPDPEPSATQVVMRSAAVKWDRRPAMSRSSDLRDAVDRWPPASTARSSVVVSLMLR